MRCFKQEQQQRGRFLRFESKVNRRRFWAYDLVNTNQDMVNVVRLFRSSRESQLFM